MIRFACPGCQATYTVGDEKAGKTGKCPKCQAQFIIPTPDGATAPPPPPPPPPRPPAPRPPAPAPKAAAAPQEIEIAPCPGCQARLVVSTTDLGADVECPHCQTVYTAARPVPGGAAPPRPSSRRPADAEADRPSRRGRSRDEEDEDDRPSRRGRKRDEDEDDRPSRRGRRDDEDDEDNRPRRKRAGGDANNPALRIISAVLSLLIGSGYLMCGIGIMVFGAAVMSFFSGTDFGGPAVNPQQAQARDNLRQGANVATAVFVGCGLTLLLFSLLYVIAGVGALTRSPFGKVMTVVVAVISSFTAFLMFGGFGLSLVAGEARGMATNFAQLLVFAGHAVTSFMCTLGKHGRQFR